MLDKILSTPSWQETLYCERRPILLYGGGNGADKIKRELDRHGIRISGVAVSNDFARGKSIYGFDTFPISDAEDKFGDFVCILCFGAEGEEVKSIFTLAEKHRVICPDAPLFGEEWQSKELMLAERDDIMRIYDLLCDETSRRIFAENLMLSVSGEISSLHWLDGDDRMPDVYYSHGKTHIDVGAFDGDTALEYAAESSSEILAFEPDPVTFGKLKKNTSHLKNITCINAAVSNFCGEVGVDASHSRGSSIVSGTGHDCVTVDSITGRRYAFTGGIPVGSIKTDAEGNELKVLEGAVNTICEERPVLAVSVYHRAGDIWRLPLYLHRLCGKYKFLIRRKPCLLPAWDTLAATIENGAIYDSNSTYTKA